MMKFLLLFSAVIIFFGCQKQLSELPGDNGSNDDDTTTTQAIAGNWDFIFMNAELKNIVAFDSLGVSYKSISSLEYTTINNAGSITINDSTINTTGLTYSIASKIKTLLYKNDAISDSSEASLNLMFADTQSVTIYKLIGVDSIFFPKGAFTNISGSTFRINPTPAKIHIQGDTLKFIQPVYQDSIINRSGINYHIVQTGNASITLLKK